MTNNYNELIISTFRDQPIKSVLLIDDKFSPYENIIDSVIHSQEKLAELNASIGIIDNALLSECVNIINDELTTKLLESSRAKFFSKYFHAKKINCDVENDTDNLEPEKIRKSDLIILDYHLRDDDPGQSLNLLKSLCDSPHLNMVVVYTSENLNKTWLQVAASLRGVPDLDEDEFLKTEELKAAWYDLTDGNEVPMLWDNLLTEEQIATYLLTDIFPNRARGQIVKGRFHPDVKIQNQHFDYYINKKVDAYNILNTAQREQHLHGDFISQDCKWLQIGNIFVTFCSKGAELEKQPKMVWDQLETALLNWNPNFYRVVTSELQNRIEDANLAMPKVMKKDINEQIALLWSVLVSKEDEQLLSSSKVLDYLLQDISNKLSMDLDGAISSFIKKVAISSYSENIQHVDMYDPDYNEFVRSMMDVAYNNIGIKPKDDKIYENIAHAHNEQISTIRAYPLYITSGMVLYNENKKWWFLCVTPSCDTIPNQGSDSQKTKWAPHRQMTLLRLKQDTLHAALKTASECKHIFISHNDKRYALRIMDKETNMPSLEKVIVKNHDHNDMVHSGRDVIFFSTKGDDIEQKVSRLIPITLLKPAYAARYQNAQSHYEGRIGVDFISLK